MGGSPPSKPGKHTASHHSPSRLFRGVWRPELAREKCGYIDKFFSKHDVTSVGALHHHHHFRYLVFQGMQAREELLYLLIYLCCWKQQVQHASFPSLTPQAKKRHIRTLVGIGRLRKFLTITLTVDTPFINEFLPSSLILLE